MGDEEWSSKGMHIFLQTKFTENANTTRFAVIISEKGR